MASEFDVSLSGYFAHEEPGDKWRFVGTRERPARGAFFFDFANRAMNSGREVVLVAEGDAAGEAMERIKELLKKPMGPERTRERTLLWWNASVTEQGGSESWMPPLVAAVLARSSEASKNSRIHGSGHWARVAVAGLTLADRVDGADALTLLLFSLLHDSMRENDGHDPRHGGRAADLARTLRDEGVFDLDDTRMALLEEACIHHDKGATSSEPTIGACFDADRLDLWRTGKRPDPALLSTEAGRSMVETTRPYSRIRFDWRAIFLNYAAAELGRGAVYIRFGEPPPGGRSAVPMGFGAELGVSAFLAAPLERGEARRYRIDLHALLMGAESRFVRRLLYEGRPAFMLRGKRVGMGQLGEPVLSDAQIVSEIPPDKLEVSPEWPEVVSALSWWRSKRAGEDPGPPPRLWWQSLPGDRALAPVDLGGAGGADEGFMQAVERMKREKLGQWGLLEAYEELQTSKREPKPDPPELPGTVAVCGLPPELRARVSGVPSKGGRRW